MSKLNLRMSEEVWPPSLTKVTNYFCRFNFFQSKRRRMFCELIYSKITENYIHGEMMDTGPSVQHPPLCTTARYYSFHLRNSFSKKESAHSTTGGNGRGRSVCTVAPGVYNRIRALYHRNTLLLWPDYFCLAFHWH